MRMLIALSFAIAATAAAAYDPIVTKQGWWRVDAFASGECAGEVGTNGKFYVISARGFGPGAPAYLTITNGDMKPIARPVRADAEGRWHDYYIPFRYDRDGGAVDVTVASADCVIPLSFVWTRARGWDEPVPLVPR